MPTLTSSIASISRRLSFVVSKAVTNSIGFAATYLRAFSLFIMYVTQGADFVGGDVVGGGGVTVTFVATVLSCSIKVIATIAVR